MIIVIDNYDSFTYNLVQYLGELGAEPWVFRNDRVTVGELVSMHPSHIVISPGPGTPERDAGISNDVIRRFHGDVPILGVCLGHQCIAYTFGGEVGRAPRLMHGKVSRVMHHGDPLYAGIPTHFEATRYHSLIVKEPIPDELEVIARTAEGEIMSLRHKRALTYGVQFHPESILTPHGKRLLQNFMRMGSEPSHQTSAAGMVSAPKAPEASVSIDLPTALERILASEHLTASEAEAVMQIIMSGGATPAQIGGILVALRAKGETISEITGFARAMRRNATAVRPTRRPLIDTCGTGGDGAHTFNISTTAAFVVAGAGVAVAKHGNRSVSSKSGSADVLQALGVNLDLSPEQVAQCIDDVGLGFLYAPLLHPAMKHAIGPRREMKIRTVFNVLGPLTNPAGASAQLIGVYDLDLVSPIAHVLGELGSDAAFVVHNHDRLDELATTSINHVARLKDGQVSTFELAPEEYGFERSSLSDIRGGDSAVNARITRELLNGARGPRRDTVLLNAAAALVAGGAAGDLREGIGLAEHSIDSGRARLVLEDLIAFTQGAA